MVRFSDMLGGSGDGDEPSADPAPAPVTARELPPDGDESGDPDAPPPKGTVQFVDQVGLRPPPAASVVDAPEPPPGPQSPQDVLDRLTQYASSTRAAERALAPEPPAAEASPPPPPPPPAGAAAREPDPPPAPSAAPPEPAGDDLLPRAKRTLRRPGRGDKPRP